MVLTAQGWLQALYTHTDSSLQRQGLLFTATNNRSKGMLTWIWSTACNSILPSLSHTLIDLDASVKSPSPCAASWLCGLWLVGEGRCVGCVEGGRVPPDRFGAITKGHLQSGGQSAGMRQSKGSLATSPRSEDPPVSLAGNPLYYICWLSKTRGLYVVLFSSTPPKLNPSSWHITSEFILFRISFSPALTRLSS